jgi:hypothetical protein
MNTVRINGDDYTSSLSEAELAFIGPLSLPTGINSLSEGIVKHEEDITELNSNIDKKINVSPQYGNITSSTVNNFTDNGIFSVYLDGTMPYTNTWGTLIVVSAYPAVCEQIILTQKGIAIRHYESGAWTAWKKVALA